MSTIEVRVPQLPESVADATVVAWRKQPGDAVTRDENLVDLETDKVVLEVPAPSAGVIRELKVQNGATVTGGQVLAIIEEGASTSPTKVGEVARSAGEGATSSAKSAAGTSPAKAAAGTSPAAAGEVARSAGEGSDKLAPSVRRLVEEHKLEPSSIQGSGRDGRITKGDVLRQLASGTSPAAAGEVKTQGDKLAPSVRRLVEEHKLEPSSIQGSGRDGRITKGDVLKQLADKDKPASGTSPAAAGEVAKVRTPSPGVPPTSPTPVGEVRGERRVPMTRLRARIAERLVQAQSTAAMLTTFNEVDLKAVNELRARYKERFEKEHGARLGFMSFFVKACVEALKRFPVVNASVDGNDIVYHEYYDIGVAVSTERGLIVPVLRDADSLSFAEIEKSVVAYATRARDGALTLEELTGGTFTITNGGVFGSLLSTPILNMPQSAILGMHKIQERPVVIDGQVVVRPMMYLAMSYDHRIIDGKDAVQFLVAVKESLEDPSRLLLQI